MPDNEVFRLSDLDIMTVGLVTRGANKKTFYLVKSEEGMPDKVEIEEVASNTIREQLSKFLDAITKPFQRAPVAKALSESDKQVILATATALSETDGLSEPVAMMLNSVKAALTTGATPPAQEEEEEEEMMAEEMEMADLPAETTQAGAGGGTPASMTLQKSAKQAMNRQLDAIEKAAEARVKAIEAATKAQLEAIEKQHQAQLAILEKQAHEAIEAREKREWLEKADRIGRSLPVNSQELADHLHAIHKAAPDQAEWLTTLLKSTDHALFEAGFFSEFGTARTAEEKDLIEKTEGKSYEEIEKALLGLSPEEQEAYLEATRHPKRQGENR